jgi:hypothetical protein
MCLFFMEEFEGRPLGDESVGTRWLVSDAGVDVAQLRNAAELAARQGECLLVLATSLSLQLLLRDQGDETVPLPPNSAVMLTGGNKGRREATDPEQLSQQVCDLFAIAPEQLIGEYGMTELSSQLYEGSRWQPTAAPGIYFAPPWLQVTPVDPISLQPVTEGEPGLARFVDLANVDSALVIVTRDLVRQEGSGIRLLGRQPHSPLRGCSLLIEPFLG